MHAQRTGGAITPTLEDRITFQQSEPQIRIGITYDMPNAGPGSTHAVHVRRLDSHALARRRDWRTAVPLPRLVPPEPKCRESGGKSECDQHNTSHRFNMATDPHIPPPRPPPGINRPPCLSFNPLSHMSFTIQEDIEGFTELAYT